MEKYISEDELIRLRTLVLDLQREKKEALDQIVKKNDYQITEILNEKNLEISELEKEKVSAQLELQRTIDKIQNLLNVFEEEKNEFNKLKSEFQSREEESKTKIRELERYDNLSIFILTHLAE